MALKRPLPHVSVVQHGAPKRIRHVEPFLAAECGGRAFALRRDPNYQQTIASIERVLKDICGQEIILEARMPGFSEILEIPEDIWAEVLPDLSRVSVRLVDASRKRECNCGCQRIFVQTPDGKRTPVYIHLGHTVNLLEDKIHDALGLQQDTFRLYFIGEYLQTPKTLSIYEIEEDEVIDLWPERPGNKPGIYFFPPTREFGIQARLTVSQPWALSTLYPPTPVSLNDSKEQQVTWTVNADPDGTLIDEATKRIVGNLAWEARAENIVIPKAPGHTWQSSSITMLRPRGPDSDIDRIHHAVLLPFKGVKDYIESVLAELGFPSKPRAAFVQHFLPDLAKHEYVALRFIFQNQLQSAATLDVMPVPDTMTRVFMKFQGIHPDIAQSDVWRDARSRAERGPRMWRDMAGVDVEKATDPGLFRVIGWGGVEV